MGLLQNRLKLQKKLEEILGSENVYFQPPPTVKMEYPCYVYELSDEDVRYADGARYSQMDRYKVTLISSRPKEEHFLLACLPYCSLDRVYTADNLYHYVYNLYF